MTAFSQEFSTAGFYVLPQTGRDVYSMNIAWRFSKGDFPNAQSNNFHDADWSLVSLPHGLEYLPEEASGGVNYQGIAWYRKHFFPEHALKGKKLYLHFEAIMGKSKIFVNGVLAKEHFGGYLPVIADISTLLKWGEDNVIAVMTDNSNDPVFPPGKQQEALDFCYFGGIYRDCWLVAHNSVYITDPNYENETGGGIIISYKDVSAEKATINLQACLRNDGTRFAGKIEYRLLDKEGKVKTKQSQSLQLGERSTGVYKESIDIPRPLLWTPEDPYLYNLEIRVYNNQGKVVDGYRKRIGIRSIEFRGERGFWLNGKPYTEPLIGANRHQDFATIGNALSNSLHWRDAKKLRDIGLKVIRNAHYPQDPAFMDACDELGLFVIVNTPGWQFWNKAPVFEERVYNDIRNMIRRDRNHASVWLWEPILNETSYPASFAKKARDIVAEELPAAYAASDIHARGSELFPVLFAHPSDQNNDSTRAYFTREWGDNVDDWNSHNSPSRVARSWGEMPMLIQAQHYASPPYDVTSYDMLYKQGRQHIGGALWHPFDHQRGYHPDPFYGGLMDAFRQPKYAYYMFMSQRSPQAMSRRFATGPLVHIAHEMTPFSPSDVTIYSNCEEVRLQTFAKPEEYIYHKDKKRIGMPSPVIKFSQAYDFMADKELSRKGKQQEVFMIAKGYINGSMVATDTVRPARRPEKILLWVDDEGLDLRADGSDLLRVFPKIWNSYSQRVWEC